MNINSYIKTIDKIDSYTRFGKIKRVVGLMIESVGPQVNIGNVCYIHPEKREKSQLKLLASLEKMFCSCHILKSLILVQVV